MITKEAASNVEGSGGAATNGDVPDGTAGGGTKAGVLRGSSKLWIGKDYVNFVVKDFCDLHAPFQGEGII